MNARKKTATLKRQAYFSCPQKTPKSCYFFPSMDSFKSCVAGVIFSREIKVLAYNLNKLMTPFIISTPPCVCFQESFPCVLLKLTFIVQRTPTVTKSVSHGRSSVTLPKTAGMAQMNLIVITTLAAISMTQISVAGSRPRTTRWTGYDIVKTLPLFVQVKKKRVIRAFLREYRPFWTWIQLFGPPN